MPYRICKGDAVEKEIRRVFREQLERARKELAVWEADPGEAAHQIRKRGKKLRAVLYLLRDTDREAVDAIEDRLKAMADRLEPFRTADVLSGVTGELAVPEEAVDEIRKRPEPEEAFPEGPVAADLVAAERAFDDFWVPDGLRASLKRRFRKTWQRARREWKRAGESPTGEQLHEWRKKTKRLWYLTRLGQGRGDPKLRKLRARTKEIGSILGDHHDLTDLREALQSSSGEISEETARRIRRRQDELADAAFSVGRKAHRKKTKGWLPRW